MTANLPVKATILALFSIISSGVVLTAVNLHTRVKSIPGASPRVLGATQIAFTKVHADGVFPLSADFNKNHIVTFVLFKHIHYNDLTPLQSVFNTEIGVLDTGSSFSLWQSWMKLGYISHGRAISLNSVGSRFACYRATLNKAYLLGSNNSLSAYIHVVSAPSFCIRSNAKPKMVVKGYYGTIKTGDANHDVFAFLGNNLWANKILEIDYRAKSVSLQTAARSLTEICNGSRCILVPFRMTRMSHTVPGDVGVPVISATINGKRLPLLVDTSIPDELLLYQNQFPIAGLRFTNYKSTWVPGSYAAYNRNTRRSTPMVTVVANHLRLRVPPHTFASTSKYGVLGASAFEKFGKVIFDFQHNVLILRPYRRT